MVDKTTLDAIYQVAVSVEQYGSTEHGLAPETLAQLKAVDYTQFHAASTRDPDALYSIDQSVLYQSYGINDIN